MPSPKNGIARSLVTPTAPKDAKEADDATGGSTQDASNSGSKAGSSGSSVSVSQINSVPPPLEHKPSENTDKTSWIELQLVYESNGLPVPGVNYAVTLPDGTTVATGSTDEQGLGRVECIDPGTCQISFVDLDKDAWENT